MKAISINPHTLSIEEIDIEMQANTVYTFFSSILIDELHTLDKHIIYSDANALSNGKKPFFIGSQIIIGEALILGREIYEDTPATIPLKDLETLISHEVPEFYARALALLKETDINLYRTFEVTAPSEKIQLNTEWVLYTFNIADERTREYFLDELKKVLDAKSNVEQYMAKMAQLAINAAS